MNAEWLGDVKPDDKLIRVRIELRETGISRTVIVPSWLDLDSFSRVIREAIGWDGSHRWLYYQGRNLQWHDGRTADEPKPKGNAVWHQCPYDHTLDEVLPTRGKRLYYVYDFGDDWQHLIVRLSDPAPGTAVSCEATSGVWGRDDVGGAGGLVRLVRALQVWDKDCTDDECREGELSGDKRFWFGWGKKAVREKFLAGPTVSEVGDKIRALFTEWSSDKRPSLSREEIWGHE